MSIVLALLLLGLVGLRSVDQRESSVSTVADDATPMVVSAVDLYVALATADAAASTSFVRTGPEAVELRAAYLDQIARAQRELTAISQMPGLAGSSEEAITVILDRLIAYTGRIEIARTNHRLGNIVGGAYQRSASQVMRDDLLPAATTIYTDAARRLDRGLRQGRAPGAEVLVIGVAIVALLVIALTHLFVTRRTRRWLNVGLLGAFVLVAGLMIWMGTGLASQRNTFGRAQRDGSEPLIVHSVARILALRSLTDENLDLIERGTDSDTSGDFETMVARVGGTDGRSGLLAQLRHLSDDDDVQVRIDRISDLYVDYLAAHGQVQAAVDQGDDADAIDVAVGNQVAASASLDAAFDAEIDAVRSELELGTDHASDRLQWMPPALVALVALAGSAALAGMWPRLREYR